MKQKMNLNAVRRFLLVFYAMLLSLTAAAQDVTGILGTVTDENGDPVIGATVVEKAQPKNATITDLDGKFNIKVAPNSKLLVSYVGYVTREVTAQNGMTVSLKEDAQMLNDVVVIGYGVQKKSVVTAAISKVTGDDLDLTKPSRIEDALKGKVRLLVSQVLLQSLPFVVVAQSTTLILFTLSMVWLLRVVSAT